MVRKKGVFAQNKKIINLFSIENSYYPHCEDVMKKDELATSISLWPHSKDTSIMLNEEQEAAMRKALQKPLQLIHGPPGMC